MHKEQALIDHMLSLEYESANTDQLSVGTAICAKRIGHKYQMTDENAAHISTHAALVCKDKPECAACHIAKLCNYYRKATNLSTLCNTPTMVDLFCGAGGFSLGFSQAGFYPLLAIDNQQCCVDTYRINHPEIQEEHILCKSIENALSDILNSVGSSKVDVVIGGPPCQGFSTANRQRLIDDPRNKLYMHFVRTIDALKPTFFVMENVIGILSIKKQIIEDFHNLSEGYRVLPLTVNAMDYGVPQNRQRVFFIGTRTGVDLHSLIDRIVSDGSKRRRTTLNDALFGLRPLEACKIKNSVYMDSDSAGSTVEKNKINQSNAYIDLINNGCNSRFVFNHRARYNNERDIRIFDIMKSGDKSDDPKIADIMPYTSRNGIFRDKYYRLYGDRPCKTITAHMKYDCNMYIHPQQARGLTPREAARVQSYPDDYYFTGPYTKAYMQIGNSVPPLIARTIAEAILFYLQQIAEK